MDEFWVFGYGSLMWRPGFDFIEKREARLFGYSRRLCVSSFVHRGTPERPGLVFGLDAGGSCRGIAFKVCQNKKEEVLEYLRVREQTTMVYLERHHRVFFSKDKSAPALTFVVDRHHEQYAGGLTADQAVKQVSGSVGGSGPNEEYIENTVRHLREMKIHDRHMEEIFSKLNL